MPGGFVAVHCGAGIHKTRLHSNYQKLAKTSTKAGIEVLRNGGTALEAAKASVVVLENDPLTNAGYGSNLTLRGDVEMDAAVMDGKTLNYGGCGAVRQVKNPIDLAYDICMKQSSTLPMGLVPPSLLVGEGGYYHAKAAGLELVQNKDLVSDKAQWQLEKYKNVLAKVQNAALDTVGAVCMDDNGHVAAAASSGGLLLKRPGRVGQAALYASGVWADSLEPTVEPSVAVVTSGCGEYLVKTQLAKEVGIDMKTTDCPAMGLYASLTDKFLRSRHLISVVKKLGAALVLHVTRDGEGSVLWGHSTESMCVGYMNITDEKPKSIVSQLPKEVTVGTNVTVGGSHFQFVLSE